MTDINEVRDVFRGELKTMLEERDTKSTHLAEQIEHLKTKSDTDSADIKGRLDDTKGDIEKLSASIAAHERRWHRPSLP